MKKYGLLVISTISVHCAGAMKKYGLLVISTFLVHCAGVLAYFFFIILRDGVIIFGEPNRPILTAEFVMAVVWTLVGIFFMVVAILGLFKRRAGVPGYTHGHNKIPPKK